MLHVRETHVEKPRYPVIDFHTHITFSAKGEKGVPMVAERRYNAAPEELIKVMDSTNLRTMVNLTGGYGSGLAETAKKYDKLFPDRFYTFTEPAIRRFWIPTIPANRPKQSSRLTATEPADSRFSRRSDSIFSENVTTGKLIKIDDPRFDPMWDVCGQLKMPVAIHISDPSAFFLPTDRFNERYEELNNHPDWSYCDHDFPSNVELLAARNRMIAKHPNTQFRTLHVGNYAENLENVSQAMDRFPNMLVDLAARVGELGRQPRTARAFFEKYQDRIVFGTDATPHARNYPQQYFCGDLYRHLLSIPGDGRRVL